MKINYIESKSGKKTFSFNRHDYKINEDGNFIDGGFDYTRTNTAVKSDEIKNLIADIREQFRWGKNYDKDDNLLPQTEWILLKDLTTDHIIAILAYFTERFLKNPSDSGLIFIDEKWIAYHLFFIYELQYRYEQIN